MKRKDAISILRSRAEYVALHPDAFIPPSELLDGVEVTIKINGVLDNCISTKAHTRLLTELDDEEEK